MQPFSMGIMMTLRVNRREFIWSKCPWKTLRHCMQQEETAKESRSLMKMTFNSLGNCSQNIYKDRKKKRKTPRSILRA